MKIIKHVDLPVIPSKESAHPTRIRLASFKYEDLMPVLVENYEKSPGDETRVAFFDMLDHVVTIRSLKLRTFIHNHIKGDCSCTGVNCGITPTHFTLEKDINNRRGRDQTAYLSLYGVNEKGEEVEFTHDHTLARCFGGANSLINTTVMCQPCNNLKSRIESRMHNKTLSVLKQFLEETTGQPADPHFVLERLRKNQYNQALPNESEMVYERADVLSLEAGLHLIRSPDPYVEWGDKRIRTDGVRLSAFAHHLQPHCQDPECQIQATHFAVERVQGKQKNSQQGYFLNMYAVKNGEEVSFHHHHVIKPGEDGVPESLSIAILCRDCKTKNLANEITQVSSTLFDAYQGVTKEQADELSVAPSIPKSSGMSIPHPQNASKKTTNLFAALQVMSKHYNMSEADFIQWCNIRGMQLNLSGKIKKNPTIKKMIKTFPITIAGARYFRQLQRALFNPLSDDLCAKSEDIVKAKQQNQNTLLQSYVEKKKDRTLHFVFEPNQTPEKLPVLQPFDVASKLHATRQSRPGSSIPTPSLTDQAHEAFAHALVDLQNQYHCSEEQLWQMSRVMWHQATTTKNFSNTSVRQKQSLITAIAEQYNAPEPMVIVLLTLMNPRAKLLQGFRHLQTDGQPWQEVWNQWTQAGFDPSWSRSHFTAKTRLPLSMTLNNRMDNMVSMALYALAQKNHLTVNEYIEQCTNSPTSEAINCPPHFGYALKQIPEQAQGAFLKDCAQWLQWGPLSPPQINAPCFFEECDRYLKGKPVPLRLNGQTFGCDLSLQNVARPSTRISA